MYRAIVADDEKYILDGLSQLIESFDLKIHVVAKALDGKLAQDLFIKHQPDFLFIDINMPNLTGLACIESIQSIKSTTQIIIISSYDHFEYAKKAIQLGVLAYLLKPIDDDELYEVIKQGIQKLNPLTADDEQLQEHDHRHQIVAFINQNYANPNLSSDLIEQTFSLSRTTIFNLMKQITDKSLNEYITMIRIRKACYWLKENPNLQLKEIALFCGYHDPYYFSRVFKKQTGYSPSDYRRMSEKGTL